MEMVENPYHSVKVYGNNIKSGWKPFETIWTQYENNMERKTTRLIYYDVTAN